MDEVSARRRQDLEGRSTDLQHSKAGRLLVYFPDADLSDGAAPAASDDFFDLFNAPPWGTWIAYFEDGTDPNYSNFLLAWVPAELIAIVDEGIKVNPEECIAWLRDRTSKDWSLLEHAVTRSRLTQR